MPVIIAAAIPPRSDFLNMITPPEKNAVHRCSPVGAGTFTVTEPIKKQIVHALVAKVSHFYHGSPACGAFCEHEKALGSTPDTGVNRVCFEAFTG
ncbi:MAG: hypothetical protein PVI91_12685, partial [Gammaproteobacteria bacterium]